MVRWLAVGVMLWGIAACTTVNDLDKAPVDLGDFHLGHNVVVAPNLRQGPLSRDASQDMWIRYMYSAVEERFRRYEGTRLYHLGITLEAYVLAKGGIPVVAAPKSALVLKVTLWDDARKMRLNETAELIAIVESLSGNSVVGSGLTQTREEQMIQLSRQAAKRIETWMVEQNRINGWFAGREDEVQPETGAVRSGVTPDRVAGGG